MQAFAMVRTPGYPPSSLRFDWIMSVLAVVLMAGVIQDGWAHSHGLVDQSFLTPWHAILYGTMILNGIVLGGYAVWNVSHGYALRYALPRGYWVSLIGVVVFAVGGAFDLYWHTRYGIETDINALISPSHLWLATGGAMVFVGPLTSVASRYGPQTGGWRIAGPAILSCVALLTLLGFFTQYAQPMGDAEMVAVIGPHPPQTGGALYAVRSDGTNERRLLTIPYADIWSVTASPDGKHIAFRVAHDRDPGADIYVASADGTHVQRITHSGRRDTQPRWSPDGKRIVFVSIPAGTSGNYELRTIAPDGSGLRTLVSQGTALQLPVWSPDGKRIAFQTRNGLHQQIAIVRADLSSLPSWLDKTEGGSQPAWSSNNTIAFVTEDGSIAVTDSRGAAVREIEHDPVNPASFPAWSRDGKHLAFIRQLGGDAQVFVVSANGKPENTSQLPGLNASRPTWTPRGDLLFTATARPNPATTFIGLAYSEDANLIEAIVVAGIVLLLLRRWRMPFGAITVLLGLFAVAMAFQSDLFYQIITAVVTGLLADIAIALLGERARGGLPFYALGFAIPFVLMTLYLLAAKIAGGLGWPPNMIFGSPIIAGFAGMLISFCFDPPLQEASAT